MIINIDNQPWRFREENIINAQSCECRGKEYLKVVGKNDVNCFQVKNDTQVFENGDFDGNLTGWDIATSLLIDLDTTNVTFLGTCDGTATANITGGTPSYTYSLDGVTYQVSNAFNLLCEGSYTIFVKDTVGLVVTETFDIGKSIDCSAYTSSDANDLIAIEALSIKDCEAFNFV